MWIVPKTLWARLPRVRATTIATAAVLNCMVCAQPTGTYTESESPQKSTVATAMPHNDPTSLDGGAVGPQRLPAKHKTVRQPVYAFGGSTPRGLGTRSRETIPPKSTTTRKKLPSTSAIPTPRSIERAPTSNRNNKFIATERAPASLLPQSHSHDRPAIGNYSTPSPAPALARGRGGGVSPLLDGSWQETHTAALRRASSVATMRLSPHTGSVGGSDTFVDKGRLPNGNGNVTVFCDLGLTLHESEVRAGERLYTPRVPAGGRGQDDSLVETLDFSPLTDGPDGRQSTSTPRRAQVCCCGVWTKLA